MNHNWREIIAAVFGVSANMSCCNTLSKKNQSTNFHKFSNIIHLIETNAKEKIWSLMYLYRAHVKTKIWLEIY